MIKKHKKLLIRIGSFFACVLLVVGLAFPCFALDNNSSYYDVVNQYVDDLGVFNSSYSYVMSNMLLQNTTDQFNQWLTSLDGIITGSYVPNGAIPDLVGTSSIFTSASDSAAGYGSIAGYCCVCISLIQNDEVVYRYYGPRTHLAVVSIPNGDGGLDGMIVGLNSDNGDMFTVLCSRSNADQNYLDAYGTTDYGPILFVTPDSQSFSYSDTQIDVFVGYYFSYVGQADAARVLLADDLAYSFSPRSIISGWIYGTNVDDGVSSEDLQNAYNQGYNAGESVAFGEQLLGNSFKTPFEMLSRFTLFEWTDDAGNHHSINLAIVLGAGIGIVLFVWFLKLFAGG